MSAEMGSKIKLLSSDGEQLEVDIDVAKTFFTIKTMLEDLGLSADTTETVPLPNVNGPILKKVVEWSTFHKNDAPPVEDDDKEKKSDDIPAWDLDYLKKLDQAELFEVILAANYLDIKGLLEVACKHVANMMKGKTAEEIRRMFNIKNDFTAAEEEQIKKENEWSEDK